MQMGGLRLMHYDGSPQPRPGRGSIHYGQRTRAQTNMCAHACTVWTRFITTKTNDCVLNYGRQVWKESKLKVHIVTFWWLKCRAKGITKKQAVTFWANKISNRVLMNDEKVRRVNDLKLIKNHYLFIALTVLTSVTLRTCNNIRKKKHLVQHKNCKF